jgi:3-deoxy-D-manno-octulosonic-acid transferase
MIIFTPSGLDGLYHFIKGRLRDIIIDKPLMFCLYNIFVQVYTGLIRLASIYNPKARQWISGRKDIFRTISANIDKTQKYIWFHTASLGEFEQGRPVIEALRQKYPEYKIILTFFSPSGYEIRKNYEGADHIFYLPADTRRNANQFLELVTPAMVFIVKYEFWFNYIDAIFKKNIPLYFFSVKFRPKQYFFAWYGGWFRKNLLKINRIFVQDKPSLLLLQSTGYMNGSISGDTRFDRVLTVASQKKAFPLVAAFAENSKVLIAGSTWPPDENMLMYLINNNSGNVKYIIAPHEIHTERIRTFQAGISVKSIRFSEATAENISDACVLIIDNIGILLHLYQYADFSYIGGGFGKNVHNILEAATFGVPVVFGPNYHKFQEIIDLIALGGAFPVKDYETFEKALLKLQNDDAFRGECSEICRNFVKDSAGATEIILKYLAEDLPS